MAYSRYFGRRLIAAGGLAVAKYLKGRIKKPSMNKKKMKYKYRKKSSKTKRRSRVRRKSVPRLQSHADMSLIKFSLGGRKRTRKLNRDSRITFTDTYANMHDVQTGIQGVFVGRYHLHRNQLTQGNVGLPVGSDAEGYNINLYDLNVDKTLSGSTSGNGTTVLNGQINGIDQDAIYIGSHHVSMSVTSFSNVAAHIELYYLLAKKDSNGNPLNTWSNDANYLSNPQG